MKMRDEFCKGGCLSKKGSRHDFNFDRSDMHISEQILITMSRLSKLSRAAFDGKSSQKRILHLLYKTGGMTQRELTERMDIQPGSASEVITKLESAELVTRSVSKNDRRTANLALTPAGIAQAQENEHQRKVRMDEMFHALSPEEQALLLSLLEKLSDDWVPRYRGEGRRKCETETKTEESDCE